MATIYPVIMCGGSGTRLWPASRLSRPKQFMPLASDRSLFQEAVERVVPLLTDGGALIVVGGQTHHLTILNQLDEIGAAAVVLLEPEGRDSAATMAVAALWTARQDPEAVNLFVASDHHIPDHEAFRAAVRTGMGAAVAGRIVTFGVTPNGPSSAYGYIAPSGPGLSDIAAFVEKPDRDAAQRHIDDGCLWNSGDFIVRADVLRAELANQAPAVLAAARDGLESAAPKGRCIMLGARFGDAPKISIDYAIMEKTRRGSVLPVSFAWSDLGTWDAVQASGEGDIGLHVLEDAEGCLVRACDGVMVAAVGVRDIGIIVERDAVLVTNLARSQDVRKVVERLGELSPRHLDFPAEPMETLHDGAERLTTWLRQAALPVWCALGQDSSGAFEELLAQDGRHVATSRRARVQPRQLQVYAEAGRQGWRGPWRAVIDAGLERLRRLYLRPDGLMRTLLAADGSPLDETAMIYDQAFLLFALASITDATGNRTLEAEAVAVRDLLLRNADAHGGLKEAGAHPYQSNAHMHLLEAALAWEAVGEDDGWVLLADRIVALARSRFIDAEGGFLREFFASDWSPAEGEDGRRVEPGHQFEWAWLLARYARARSDDGALRDAWRLYACGLKGLDPKRGVAVDAVDQDGAFRTYRARLWPQTEWLKASLILASLSDDGPRADCLEQAADALRTVWRYLTPQGLWRDTMLEDGAFIDEPAPASTFYHVMAAYVQLRETIEKLEPQREGSVRLS